MCVPSSPGPRATSQGLWKVCSLSFLVPCWVRDITSSHTALPSASPSYHELWRARTKLLLKIMDPEPLSLQQVCPHSYSTLSPAGLGSTEPGRFHFLAQPPEWSLPAFSPMWKWTWPSLSEGNFGSLATYIKSLRTTRAFDCDSPSRNHILEQ
jgi:hypothetical protein